SGAERVDGRYRLVQPMQGEAIEQVVRDVFGGPAVGSDVGSNLRSILGHRGELVADGGDERIDPWLSRLLRRVRRLTIAHATNQRKCQRRRKRAHADILPRQAGSAP